MVCARMELMITVRRKVVLPDILDPVIRTPLEFIAISLGTQFSIKGWIIFFDSRIPGEAVRSGVQVCMIPARREATDKAESISPIKSNIVRIDFFFVSTSRIR